jgi:N-acetylmuramoyl-L-alanine amidase
MYIKIILPVLCTLFLTAAGSWADDVNIAEKVTLKNTGVKKVVIDAGHGGKDQGGSRLFGLKEKEMNLLVAKTLYDLLKKEKIFTTRLTRDSDVFIPLEERSHMANESKADIFISIHANACGKRKESGFEIYFMSENASDPGAAEVADYENSVLGLEEDGGQKDPADILLHSLARNEYINDGSRLAGLVAVEMEKGTPFANRGVKQAAFYVLRGTYAPGILVEMGFMTNSSDQKKLNNRRVQAKIAKAIYKGVMNYAEMKGWGGKW